MLRAAAKAVTQVTQFDLTDFENNNTVKAFEKVESVIEESFTSFGVSFVFLCLLCPLTLNSCHAAGQGMVREEECSKGGVGKG